MESAVQDIPEMLIYEMVDGEPIYYHGYKEYLQGDKSIEEVMGSSKLQSLIIAELIFLLRSFLGDEYLIFTNELGLQFSKKSWRAADIAVIKSALVDQIDDKYLEKAPELVIEIDTKADLKEIKNPLGYYQEKTDELIKFGVEKVIWVFSETEKVMIAEKSSKWLIIDWHEEIEITKGLTINLEKIVESRRKKI